MMLLSKNPIYIREPDDGSLSEGKDEMVVGCGLGFLFFVHRDFTQLFLK
jgi:hypothetical protein